MPRERDLRGRRGKDGRGVGVAKSESEAVEEAVVGVPEVEARGSVPGQEIPVSGNGGAAMCGEERVLRKRDPLDFVFGSLGVAWAGLRARVQRDSHRCCCFMLRSFFLRVSLSQFEPLLFFFPARWFLDV